MIENDMFPRTEDDTPVTALERRAVLQRRVKTWIKIWLICAFLACTPLLYAYANFRTVKGELFFRAINTEPGILYARTHDTRFHNTWGIDTWEELTRRVYGAPKDMDARMIFWWGSHADAVPDEPGRPERLVAVVTRGKTTLRIFIEDYPQQSEEDFNRDYPGLVDGIVRRFTDQGTLSWKEATAVQLRWLPSLVGHYVGLIGIDYAFVYLQMAVRFLVILPGFLPLLLLVLSPSWLALSVFWLWIVLSALYVVLPQKAWKWTGNALRRGCSVVWRRKSA